MQHLQPTTYEAIPRWGDCMNWYAQHHPHEVQADQTVIGVDGAPLADWAGYWNEFVVPLTEPGYQPPSRTSEEALVRLQGVPHVTNPVDLERILKADAAYLCITGSRTVRTGSWLDIKRSESEPIMPSMERVLLNALLLGELCTGRGVTIADLARWGGLAEAKANTAMTKYLIPRLNPGKRLHFIQTAGRGKYRINPDAIIVDYREPMR